jgi:hypothetical protein
LLVAVDDQADDAVVADAVADGVADAVADDVAVDRDDLEDDGGPVDDSAVFLSPQFPRPVL